MTTPATPNVTAPSPTSAPQSNPPTRPEPTAIQYGDGPLPHSGPGQPPAPQRKTKKRNNHRGGKKKRPRRQSFAQLSDDGMGHSEGRDVRNSGMRSSFYGQGGNISNTSLESATLLDHRDQPSSSRPRRTSNAQNAFGTFDGSMSYRPSYSNPFISQETTRARAAPSGNSSPEDEEDEAGRSERAPLLSSSGRKAMAKVFDEYGSPSGSRSGKARRESSRSSGRSKRRTIFDKDKLQAVPAQDYNVNYPPSMPGSPQMGTNRDMSFGDMLVRDDFGPGRASALDLGDDFALTNDEDGTAHGGSVPTTPRRGSAFDRRHTIAALHAEEDVCFPIEGMSEIGDEEPVRERRGEAGRRHRRGKWPDLAMLEDWSAYEKEGRGEGRRAKKITEPQLIGGRLRPIHKGWHRAEDDAPYRFTYFNEDLQTTIHAATISELPQPEVGGFREMFIPDRPELEDSSSEEDEEEAPPEVSFRHVVGLNGDSRVGTRQSSLIDQPRTDSRQSRRPVSLGGDGPPESQRTSGEATPMLKSSSNEFGNGPGNGEKPQKQKRYGERPTWWLDVLSPTDAEMKVISKTFGIHPLTAEDIMMQEAREKVELFKNYYFVNYRSFEQDMSNEDFLEPVNMYVVVFREGVLSFHFSMTPHPANVRRRIRQLKDYMILSSDWISYAIIDDITDVFAPLIQNIEDEVDDIDDAILRLHSPDDSDHEKNSNQRDSEKKSESGDLTSVERGGDMLRRVGDCRKKVMGLYRLLGNKADVIKGFAKRCNEHWEVAPRSEIGLYLGDIQDHIVTMTGNLSHYEKILARSHGNYLAQINIRMNERQEQTADVLGKLTVLGTIVLPMNIITGLWGMNVWVPGQEYEGSLTWFWCITAGLLCFGLACFYIAKIAYRIV